MPDICFSCFMGGNIMNLINRKQQKDTDQSGAPVEIGAGEVLSRRLDKIQTVQKVSSCWRYLVTFRLEPDGEMELETDEETYGQLKEHTRCQISWQGTSLLTHIPEGGTSK